jgi:hypothetical protein
MNASMFELWVILGYGANGGQSAIERNLEARLKPAEVRLLRGVA